MIAAARNYLIALSNWQTLIWLAVPKLLQVYTAGSKMRFVMVLAEPLIVIIGFYVVRGLLKQQTPNYGTSLFLFYASGILPYYFFLRVSTRTRSAATRPGAVLPGVTSLDVYIAAVVLNSIIWTTMMIVIFLGMWFYGIDQAKPYSVATCAIPVLLLVALGTGVGMINNVINRFLPFWSALYAILTRGLVFLSGVLIIVDLSPPFLRAIAVWNPLAHAIEWFRLGVYGRYPHNSLSPSYLVAWTLIVLFLGLVIDRAAIRKNVER